MVFAFAGLFVAMALPVSQPDVAAAKASAGTIHTRLQQGQSPGDGSSSTTAMVPEQIRKAEPPSPNASAAELEQQGDMLREQREFADALDYYRAAMNKANSAVLNNKAGIADLQLLRIEEARHAFERAIHMDKNYAEAYNNLGVIEYYKKKYGKAIHLYHTAIQLEDASAFHSNLGTAHFVKKEYQKASQEYGRALQLDPEVFERQSRSGISLLMMNTQDRARFDYIIAKMYASVGNADRCLLYLRKSMEEGYPGINNVYKEQEFTQVRKDPRFVQLMSARPVPLPN